MSATATPRPMSPELAVPFTERADDGRDPISERSVTSFSQQRLWFLSQMPGANEAYNEHMAFHLRGPLDRSLLASTLDELVRRHESLRTRLVSEGGEVYQRIGPSDVGYPLVMDDLTGDPDPMARLAALQHHETSEPFDLARGRLARGRLVVLGTDDHALLLTIHHSVFDGHSMNVMLTELATVYAALLEGRGSPLPELPLQFAEYARQQRQWAASDESRAQAEYWQERLSGAPPLLELPADRARPAEQDYRGGRVRITLDEELTSALRSVARRHGGTLFTAVLTGWAIVLSRLTGQTDIVIGAPTANRRDADVKQLLGFFVNSLALRLDLSGSPTGAELLAQVRAALRGALDHQDLPLERVVELINPPRSAAHTPLFQTMCASVPSREGLLRLPAIDTEPLDIPCTFAKFDLALSLAETGDRMTGHLDYAAALFEEETVERYARYLRHALVGLAESPEREIAELSLMDAEERRLLLEDFSGARAAAPVSAREGSLVERFEAEAGAHPGLPAVVHGGERLDYAALDHRANRLAHALRARGIGPDQVVALHAGRSLELVVGVLGILKAGAAYLPLDPGLPDERLAFMVEDAAPAVVLSDASSPPGGWQALVAVEAEAERDDAPRVRTLPSHLAYVIYTSGSTGRPKGVAVTHRSVLNLFDAWQARMGDAPGEAASAWSSIGFDASVHELLMPLTTGSVLHIVPDDLRGDPEALLDWMRGHRVVQAFLPPSFVKWIDEDPWTRLEGLALRQLLTGVEPLPEQALHRMRQVLPGLRVCYGYGPTEATLYSTAYSDPQPLDRPCPIGRPIAGTRLYLLDDRLQPVPVGVAGEVYLGGACLARGYLHRPDLTAERFIADPFEPQGRLYRTGDRARWLADGNAEYIGRSDDQVKLRGFRIEPGEVEAALLALPGVREAAVLADRDDSGELFLVAGIGSGDAKPRQPHEWRAALSAFLPDYMVPARFVELPHLPLSRNGKLDRTALLRHARAAAPAQVNRASPRDHVELTLYRIWQDLLLHTDIGTDDSFFDLGGTSLSAIKMAHAVREAFGRPLPVRDVILHPTIEALGALLRQGTQRPPSNLIEFRAGDGRGRVVCVHPAGGTAFCYLPLAGALPVSIGLYGVQSPGVNPGETFLPTVAAMAEAYERLLGPALDGPLVLTGLSYGGLVAHEMGRRLAAAGKRDVSVVLLDTQATEDPADRAALGPVDMAEFRDKLVKFNGMYPGIDDEQIEQYFRIYNHNRMTARDHVPAPSRARSVLVQACEGGQDTPRSRAVRAFWRAQCETNFRVEQVDCDHWELLESAEIPRVAAVIREELAQATAADRAVPEPARPTAGPETVNAPNPEAR